MRAQTNLGGSRPLVCFPGGGTFFWWELGAVSALADEYDLSGMQLSGYSAGAVAAVFGLCGVDPDKAYRIAFILAENAGVFRNPLGLAFTWGKLIDAWLRACLPDDAASSCDGAAAVVLTTFTPWPRVASVSSFADRERLIACLMASTHIPFFMDGHFARQIGSDALHAQDEAVAQHQPSVRAADGGCLKFLGLATTLSLLTHDAPAGHVATLMDPAKDEAFMAACATHGWSMLKPDGVDQFINYGRAYVQRQAAAGPAGDLAALERIRRRQRKLHRSELALVEFPANARGVLQPVVIIGALARLLAMWGARGLFQCCRGADLQRRGSAPPIPMHENKRLFSCMVGLRSTWWLAWGILRVALGVF